MSKIDTNPNGMLENLDDEGRIPITRLKDADKAQAVVAAMKRAHEPQEEIWAQVSNALDGAPPMDEGELQEAGQSWRANFNDRIMEAVAEQGLAPYQDSTYSPNVMWDIRLKASPDPKENDKWSKIVTSAWDKFNRANKQLSYVLMRSQRDMVVYGYGPIFWPDPLYYQPISIPAENLLIPEGTEANVDKWYLGGIVYKETVHGLYSYIADPKTAQASGWQLKPTREAIRKAEPKTNGGAQLSWMEYARQLRSNDLYYSAVSERIPLVWLFWRELPKKGEKEGRISVGLVSDSGNVEGWLYRKEGVYANWHQAILPMYFDIGNGDHHSVKGLGIKSLSLCTTENRMRCDQVDSAKWAGSMHWQAKDTTEFDKLSIIPMGPNFIHPMGLDIVTSPNVAQGLEAAQLIKQDILGTLTSNLTQYRPQLQRQMSGQKGNPPTAEQIQYNAQYESAISRPQMLRYFEQMDWLGEELYRRCVNPILTPDSRGWAEIAEFRQECIEQGVPEEALAQVATVKFTRTLGFGSPAARNASLDRMMMMRPAYDEEGQQTILEDWTAAQAGRDNVARYIRPPNKMAPDEEDQIERAQTQIGLAMNGKKPVVVSSQNPAIFAKQYLAAGVQAINDFKAGAPPAKVYEFLQNIGPAARLHIERLAKDPQRKPMVAQFMKQLAAMEKFTKTIGKGLQKQMQQTAQKQQQMAQQASQQNADFALKEREAQHKAMMAEQKQQHAMGLKTVQTEQKMALQDKEVAHDIRLKNFEAANKPKPKEASE